MVKIGKLPENKAHCIQGGYGAFHENCCKSFTSKMKIWESFQEYFQKDLFKALKTGAGRFGITAIEIQSGDPSQLYIFAWIKTEHRRWDLSSIKQNLVALPENHRDIKEVRSTLCHPAMPRFFDDHPRIVLSTAWILGCQPKRLQITNHGSRRHFIFSGGP